VVARVAGTILKGQGFGVFLNRRSQVGLELLFRVGFKNIGEFEKIVLSSNKLR